MEVTTYTPYWPAFGRSRRARRPPTSDGTGPAQSSHCPSAPPARTCRQIV